MTATTSQTKTSRADRISIIPPPGNSQRPGFLFVLIVAFGFLVGFGYLWYRLGESRGFTIFTSLLTTAVFAPVLWWMAREARSEIPKLKAFEESGDWASWMLSPHEYRKYASSERGSIAAKLLRPVFPVAMGGVYLLVTGAMQAGIIVLLIAPTAISLAAALFGPPSIPRDQVAEARVNEHGILLAGRFTPFNGGHPRLKRVDFEPGDPAVLIFFVKWPGTHEAAPMRVPVPAGHKDDAMELARRLNVHFGADTT